MAEIFTKAEVRKFLLSEMELTEGQLGNAVLKVDESHAEGVWSWDYSDSMTHDWGVVLIDEHGALEAELNPESASYSDLPDDGTYSADKVMKNWD